MTALRRLAVVFRAYSDYPPQAASIFRLIPGVSWSKRQSFWRQGYRAVMVAEMALSLPDYHAASDTPDKLTYPELTPVTQGLFAAFAELI
jgi:hypothetical protein